ncbi:pleckstrin homology domain-containing family B member 2 isoform X2 [Chiloscyllium plagiosum]|uniref:pleckstrin homology domain-containing family B member 2 isoform X2 n=1 Tax=Chiloscyllium plagiosum TaxID=36176 RepID=UPI001CB8473D|nr:pleckstrin homology domain-containing family B member 2 isoform X2 [Chiloscyllium plagiosum]
MGNVVVSLSGRGRGTGKTGYSVKWTTIPRGDRGTKAGLGRQTDVSCDKLGERDPLSVAEMAYVKSGWLLRQSTILKRWKNNWFDLWSNGQLVYYDDQMREDMEDKIHLRIDCINIRSGSECRDFQPPEGKPRDCLLQILCRDERTINLCAESADDCLAWKLALQEARTNTSLAPEIALDDVAYASAPPPYTSYPAAPAQKPRLYRQRSCSY